MVLKFVFQKVLWGCVVFLCFLSYFVKLLLFLFDCYWLSKDDKILRVYGVERERGMENLGVFRENDENIMYINTFLTKKVKSLLILSLSQKVY